MIATRLNPIIEREFAPQQKWQMSQLRTGSVHSKQQRKLPLKNNVMFS